MNACEEFIKRTYFWKNMRQHIEDYIKRCELCQKYKITRQNLKPPMAIEELKSEPFERIQIDIVGPIEVENREKKILTIQDNCTKYVKFIPLNSLKSEEIINKLLINWITYFGIPKQILMDNGPEFTNKLISKLCKRSKVHQHISSTIEWNH